MFKIAWSTVVRFAARRAPAQLTHSLRSGLRHLRASRSVHARPQRLVAAAGVAPARAEAQRVLSPPCLLVPTTPRRKLVRTEGIAPSWTFVHRLLGPARMLFRHIRKS